MNLAASDVKRPDELRRAESEDGRRSRFQFLFQIPKNRVEHLRFAPECLSLPFDKSSWIEGGRARCLSRRACVSRHEPCLGGKSRYRFSELGQRPRTGVNRRCPPQATSVRRSASPEAFGSSSTIRPE